MSTYTAREVRAWAHANGITCPASGPVQQRVVDAYLAAMHPGAVLADPEPEPDDEPDIDRSATIVTIQTWDEGWEAPIAEAVANLIGAIEASVRDMVLTELRQHLDGAS